MERQRMNEKYIRQQFETYWSRFERKIPAGLTAFMKTIEVAARDFLEGYEKGARRRPHKKSRRTRKPAAH